jgi:DNA repair protein RecO (recombination protein O)
MQWSGEGLIIGVKRHGESGVIVEAMVEGRGRMLGLVRGGRSQRLSPHLQPGNSALLTWRARLEEHLGSFTVEVTDSRAARLMDDRLRLYASQLLAEHLHLLPEREANDRLLGLVIRLLDAPLSPLQLGEGIARFELALIEEMGFGLDLSVCALTGTSTGLSHVSPKTGRAVSTEAARPYLDRLLRLPAFLIGSGPADQQALADAFRLSGHFLDLNIWMPRNLDAPTIRESFIRALTEL